jgi:F0F1-type ATP synthase assembly protein I
MNLGRALTASSLGMEVALCLAIGAGAGLYLDDELHTSPWLLVLFTACGVGAAAKGLSRVVAEYRRELRDEEGGQG